MGRCLLAQTEQGDRDEPGFATRGFFRGENQAEPERVGGKDSQSRNVSFGCFSTGNFLLPNNQRFLFSSDLSGKKNCCTKGTGELTPGAKPRRWSHEQFWVGPDKAFFRAFAKVVE